MKSLLKLVSKHICLIQCIYLLILKKKLIKKLKYYNCYCYMYHVCVHVVHHLSILIRIFTPGGEASRSLTVVHSRRGKLKCQNKNKKN